MIFFDNRLSPAEMINPSRCPTQLFLQGAFNALHDSSPGQQTIILRDLADYIGCEPKELHFMIMPTDVTVGSIEVPHFDHTLKEV